MILLLEKLLEFSIFFAVHHVCANFIMQIFPSHRKSLLSCSAKVLEESIEGRDCGKLNCHKLTRLDAILFFSRFTIHSTQQQLEQKFGARIFKFPPNYIQWWWRTHLVEQYNYVKSTVKGLNVECTYGTSNLEFLILYSSLVTNRHRREGWGSSVATTETRGMKSYQIYIHFCYFKRTLNCLWKYIYAMEYVTSV